MPSKRQRNLLLIDQRKLQLKWSFKWKFTANFGLLLIFSLISFAEASTDDQSKNLDLSSDESNELGFIDSIESLENNTIEANTNSDNDKPIGNKTHRKPSPLTMDMLSLIWYLTTLVALIGFFVVMACTENGCGRSNSEKPDESRTTRPPTPAPSYRLFAPPSYDSVMKKHKDRIYIVPVFENSNYFNQNLNDSNISNSSDVSSKDVVIESNNSSFDVNTSTHSTYLQIPFNSSQGEANRSRSLQNLTISLQSLTNSIPRNPSSSGSEKDEKYLAQLKV